MNPNKTLVIGVSACKYAIDGPHHVVFDKYIEALEHWVDCVPVILPALNDRKRDCDAIVEAYLSAVDGVLLTGSCSNVSPARYAEKETVDAVSVCKEVGYFDLDRDFITLSLVRRAVATKVPILGICRGFQEINVALGGSLFQSLDGRADQHRAPENVAKQSSKYKVKHDVTLTQDGVLSKMLSEVGYTEDMILVNSLHNQGIKRLADVMKCEAMTSDGLIEAASLKSKNSFCVGVQWHPEWFTEENIIYKSLFKLFGDTCQKYKETKGYYAP